MRGLNCPACKKDSVAIYFARAAVARLRPAARAFKKWTGVPPGSYRMRQAAAG